MSALQDHDDIMECFDSLQTLESAFVASCTNLEAIHDARKMLEQHVELEKYRKTLGTLCRTATHLVRILGEQFYDADIENTNKALGKLYYKIDPNVTILTKKDLGYQMASNSEAETALVYSIHGFCADQELFRESHHTLATQNATSQSLEALRLLRVLVALCRECMLQLQHRFHAQAVSHNDNTRRQLQF